MTQSLDLTNFPHIIPPDDSEEMQKRSQSLKVVRDSMENLIKLIHAYFVELKEFDSKAVYLEKQAMQLKEYEYELSQREKRLLQYDDQLKQEKAYIAQENQTIKEKQAKTENDKDYLREIQVAKEEYEERKTEALKQEGLIEEKLKLIEVLNIRQKELDEKEAVMEKSAAVDAERKRLLDIREERIRIKEQRLHMDAQE